MPTFYYGNKGKLNNKYNKHNKKKNIYPYVGIVQFLNGHHIKCYVVDLHLKNLL